eukprot:scaffold24697_cov117-Cylindrotheca_fusiformis.AAC.2
MNVFKKFQSRLNKKAKRKQQQLNKRSRFAFKSLPNEIKQRVAGFLCAKDTVHLMQTCQAMRCHLNLSIASSPLVDSRRAQIQVFPKNSTQCFAVILPNNAELVHSMTVSWTQMQWKENEDCSIWIEEQEQPRALSSPDDIESMIQISSLSSTTVASSTGSQGVRHVALTFYPKPKRIYQLFCSTRMDLGSFHWRIGNLYLHRVGFGSDALKYTACQHQIQLSGRCRGISSLNGTTVASGQLDHMVFALAMDTSAIGIRIASVFGAMHRYNLVDDADEYVSYPNEEHWGRHGAE